MRKYILLIIIIITTCCNSYIYNCYESRFVLKQDVFMQPLYLLNTTEVSRIDKIVNDSIDSLCKNVFYKEGSPIIPQEINNYCRQYSANINKTDTIVTVTFIHKNALPGFRITEDKLRNEPIVIFDGGSLFWYIIINLHSSEILKFQVNGYS